MTNRQNGYIFYLKVNILLQAFTQHPIYAHYTLRNSGMSQGFAIPVFVFFGFLIRLQSVFL